jgi:hypothetical protein
MHQSVPPGLDVNALAALCGQDAADLLVRCASLAGLPHAASDLTAQALSEHVSDVVRSERVGLASDGSEIRAWTWGRSGPRVLVYGWPHPDEPSGALVCRWLLELADHPALAGYRWVVIPCADPAASAWSERWAHGRTLDDYVYGSVRLEHLLREVDYGFPIDGRLLTMPRVRDGGRACTSAGRCVQPEVCGDTCLRLRSVPGPLPESLALAEAIDRYQPDLVAGLHNASASGAYGFWQHEPTADLLHVSAEIVEACGLPRHLGPAVDPGRAWSRAWPDARRETTLEESERAFARHHGIEPVPGQRYLGHGSIAQYMHMRTPGAEYMVPEAGLFTHPHFADTRDLGELRRLTEGSRQMASGDWVREAEGELELPWGERQQVIYRRWRGSKASDQQLELPVSVGMLMLDAVTLRRALFAAADELWKALPDSVRTGDDLYAAERRAMSTNGRWARQSTARWARSERATRPATRAQAADWRWRWALESCCSAGRMVALAERAGHAEHQLNARLREMIDATLGTLPLREVRCQAALSQLARVLYRAGEINA